MESQRGSASKFRSRIIESNCRYDSPDKKDINPSTNAVQSLIALKQSNNWKVSLFQNTPAQFHGRPELVEEMTKELSELI